MSSRSSPAYRILFACIADNRKIEYDVGDIKQWKQLAQNVVERCALDARKSFDSNGEVTVNYISRSGRIWLCIAERKLPVRIAFAYLEFVSQRSLVADKYDPTLTTTMKSGLEKYTSQDDKIQAIQAEIDAIREVMIQNMEEAILRGDDLRDLQDRTQLLATEAALFKKESTSLKNHFRWANLRWYLVGAAALLIIAVAITWGICGLTFQNCRKK